MNGIEITSRGSFNNTLSYLEKLKNFKIDKILESYGQKGVDVLRDASPRETSEMANSWTYRVINDGSTAKLEWHNSDIEGGYNVALLIQYGHGTNHGGYVLPHDYINPAMAPIFEEFARQIGEEVKRV